MRQQIQHLPLRAAKKYFFAHQYNIIRSLFLASENDKLKVH